MNAIETVLSRIDNPLRRGDSAWMAKCPSHEDRSPSLSIHVRDDGVVLLHCFAGCSALEVLDALGLTLTDLYPEPLTREESTRSTRPRHDPADLLRILDHESNIVAFAAAMIMSGDGLTDDDFERLLEAKRKIEICRAAA